MAQGISITIGPGEFIDRLTILRLKGDNARDAAHRDRVSKQLAPLEALRSAMAETPQLAQREQALTAINQRLWQAEDAVRRLSADADTNPAFLEIAQRIPELNDARARLKAEIDDLFGWQFTDIKQYDAS